MMGARRTRWAFAIGDRVRPRREWRGQRGVVPAPGRVVARQPWGDEGCYRIAGDDPRFFSARVFERAPARPRRRRP